LKDYKAYSWYGLFAPAGTRKEIVDRMPAGRDQARSGAAPGASPRHRRAVRMLGYTPPRFAQYVKDDVAV